MPIGYSSANWLLLFVLLGIVMPLMWIVGGLLAYLIVGVPFWVAVLIGAIVTPTDPVVASSIVAGGVAERNLPAKLRHAISAESGYNDGLALPFVVLPVLVLTEPPGEAVGHWVTHTVLLEIVAGAALAALMGSPSGASSTVSGASMAGILEVSAAMMRRFSRLASSNDLTRSRSSAIRTSVRSFGWSAVVRCWSAVVRS